MGLNTAQKKERSKYLQANLEITECSQRKPYAFISYASDNWETVFKSGVVPLQKQHGLRIYADKAFDKVNDKWIVPMLRNVRGADMMIVFISQSYIESYACFLELLTAVNSRKQIVFVTLGEQLHLGDTTDQPTVERGAKTEILNQGSNLSTNTNNTSNDIMRAMKSAYTSLSTLLEQDALSKYDISDAFICFFRDAFVNQKTIQDLDAVLDTIKSISCDVFDPSLTADPVHISAAPVKKPTPQPASPQEPTPQPASPQEPQAGNVQSDPSESETAVKPEDQSQPAPYAQTETAKGIEQVKPKAAPSSAQSKVKLSGFRQRISEAWKNRSEDLARVGIVAGVLSFILLFGLLFLVPVLSVLLSLFSSIFGLVCGIRSLKSGKKKSSIMAIAINVAFLLPIVLIAL